MVLLWWFKRLLDKFLAFPVRWRVWISANFFVDESNPEAAKCCCGKRDKYSSLILLDFYWHLEQLRCTLACVDLFSVCVVMKRQDFAFRELSLTQFWTCLSRPRCLVFIVAAIIIRTECFLALIYTCNSLFSACRNLGPSNVWTSWSYISWSLVYIPLCSRATRLPYQATWWLTVS